MKLRLHTSSDWTEVKLTHSKDVGRGVGVADMAYAITHRRAHRSDGKLAYHILDVMLAFEESSKSGNHIIIESSCERPTALPLGLRPNELDV